MMTLVEFIAPLKRSGTHSQRILAVLYYENRYNDVQCLTVDELRARLKSARVERWSKINVADVLSKSGHYVDSPTNRGNAKLWSITDSGAQHIRDLLGLPEAEPEIEHDVGALAGSIKKIKDPEVRGYLEEAIKCLRVGALRATVVFVWSSAVRLIQQEILTRKSSDVNSALTKHDPKARTVTKLDHFAYIKDSTTILAAQELGIFDKNEKDTVEDGLKLRNKCGHPGKYNPGEKKVSGFVEDMISVVFQSM